MGRKVIWLSAFLAGFAALLMASAASAQVLDPSFETPAIGVGAFLYNPGGSPWTFANGSGLTSPPSAFDDTAAPDGVQYAFIQGSESVISQQVTLAASVVSVK